ncbi:MAG: sigma 54-interacting transcriptional regulator [Syntrophales bacterium]|nr:sigma 54-interacting transcriptional regulator [Syntrophales bacterium]MDX9922008.1 sigma 54-interacting transcriptional regulator [Syntrophales bacterium]
MKIEMNDFKELSFGFALLDGNFSVQYINDKMASVLLRSEEWLVGKNITHLIPTMPMIPPGKISASGYVRMENGLLLSMDIVRVKEKKGLNYMIFCQDHSEYDHILDQIAISSKKKIINDKMLDSLYDGCYITDGAGHTLYVNDAFLEMTNIKRHEIIGKTVQDLVDSGIVPKSCTLKVLETGKMASMIIDYYKGKSCLVSGAPVYVDGKLERVICTVRDMTELLALKDKLAKVTSITTGLKNQLRVIEFQQANKYVAEARSRVMENIYEKAIKVASFDTPVLLLGETGVGKDFLARFMHNVNTDNSESFLIKVNCGAIPGTLLESELFGYEAGAFTDAGKQGKAGLFELASNGTMFLDEIGEMPLNLQVKLLDVIQDRTFYRVGGTKVIRTNAKIISATNSNLEELISQGKFRNDLYYRLNVITITIPPLRDRRDDIIPMALQFLDEFNRKYNKACYFAPGLLKFIMKYHWPGNIRELRNVIERLVIMSTHDTIEIETVEEQIGDEFEYTNTFERALLNEATNGRKNKHDFTPGRGTLRKQMEHFEEDVIRSRIKGTRTLKEAAARLGIDVSTLIRKKQKYGIQ